MKKVHRNLLAAVVAFVVAIQLVPVNRANPPVEEEIEVVPVVRTVLQRACYDCHSNETVWPWYSRIAPASWKVARDVHSGREALNFSTWNRYDENRRGELMRVILAEVSEGEMPPRAYDKPHPEAQLSANDRLTLKAWATTEAAATAHLDD